MKVENILSIGDTPSCRCAHKMVSHGDRIYIFGGLLSNFSQDPTLYQYNTKTFIMDKFTNYTYEFYSAAHTFVVYNNKFYSFLGYDKSTVTEYDITSDKWKELVFLNTPEGLYAHAGDIYQDKVYIFGGICMFNFQLQNSVFSFDLITQECRKELCQGYIPSPRHYHTLTTYNDKLYLFGGVGGIIHHQNLFRFDGGTHYNELIEFDPKKRLWKKIIPINDNIPSPRRSHTMNVYKDHLYLLGGYNGKKNLDDLWTFDLIQKSWKQILLDGFFFPRRFHASCINNDTLYTFGGLVEKETLSVIKEFQKITFRNDVIKMNRKNFLDVEFITC